MPARLINIKYITIRAEKVASPVTALQTGKAFGLAISRSQVQILLEETLRNNLRQVVYTYVPVTKQYNLVPAKEW